MSNESPSFSMILSPKSRGSRSGNSALTTFLAVLASGAFRGSSVEAALEARWLASRALPHGLPSRGSRQGARWRGATRFGPFGPFGRAFAGLALGCVGFNLACIQLVELGSPNEFTSGARCEGGTPGTL